MRSIRLCIASLGLTCSLLAAGCGPRIARLTPEQVKEARVESEDKTVEQIIKERDYHRGEVAKRDEQLKQKRRDAIRTKCYWVSGIALLAFFACVAAAIFLTGFRKHAVLGALACAAISALALTVAAIVNYLVIIGAVVLGILATAGIAYWRMDANSRDEVVQGFEKLKGKVGNGYKRVMREYVSPTSDKLIDKARDRMGLR